MRDEEAEELDEYLHNNCQVAVYGGVENPEGKVPWWWKKKEIIWLLHGVNATTVIFVFVLYCIVWWYKRKGGINGLL